MRKYQTYSAVFAAPVSGKEKLVWLCIVSHANETGWSFPGVETIAAETSLSVRTVQRILQKLEAKVISGLRIERGTGRGNTHRFEVSEEIEVRQPDTLSEDKERHAVTLPEPKGCQPDTDSPVVKGDKTDVKGDKRDVKGDKTDAKGCQPDTRIRSESDLIRSNQSARARTRATPPAPPRRWRRVPSGWEPNAEHRTLARDLGVDLLLEVQQFRDHEFAAPKSDPDATFRNWLRRAARAPPGGHRSRTPVQPNYGAIIQYERIE